MIVDGFYNLTLEGAHGDIPAITKDARLEAGDVIGVIGIRSVKVPARRQTFRVAIIAKRPKRGLALAWWQIRSWWFVIRHRGIAPPYAVFGS